MSDKYKIRLNKGDTVIVISGKYKGKTGKVIATHPSMNKVTVEGINVVKRHLKPTKQYPQGGIIEQTQPIYISKIAIYEPTLKTASRIKYQLTVDGKKRVYAKSGKDIK
jgi:large subunit ribosomal protein L24